MFCATLQEHLVNDLGTSYKQKQGELGQSCEMLTEVSEGLIGSMEKIKESQVVYKVIVSVIFRYTCKTLSNNVYPR